MVYLVARTSEPLLGLTYSATWNGLPLTVTQVAFVGSSPGYVVAIATVLVTVGNAGTFDLSPYWDADTSDVPDDGNLYIEKWAGVTDPVPQSPSAQSGYGNHPETNDSGPSVEHSLALCLVGRDGIPAVEGSWAPRWELVDHAHMHGPAHLSSAYRVLTGAHQLKSEKINMTAGYWGSVKLFMSAS